jgi:hypothetical protein
MSATVGMQQQCILRYHHQHKAALDLIVLSMTGRSRASIGAKAVKPQPREKKHGRQCEKKEQQMK